MATRIMTLIAALVCILAVSTVKTADNKSCGEKVLACLPESLKDIMTTMMTDTRSAMTLLCKDNSLAEEAKAFLCYVQTLKSSVCSNDPSYAAMVSPLTRMQGEFEVGRIEDGLTYMCDNREAMIRLPECMKKANMDSVLNCNKEIVLQHGNTTAFCDTISLGMNFCLNTNLYPACSEADLNVYRRVYHKILPEGCYSSAGKMAANVVIVSVIMTVCVYLGLF